MARFNIFGSVILTAALALALAGCNGAPADTAATLSPPPATSSATPLDGAAPSDAGPKGESAQPSDTAAAATASPAVGSPATTTAPVDMAAAPEASAQAAGPAPGGSAAAATPPASGATQPPRLGAAGPPAAAAKATVRISIVGDRDKGTILAAVSAPLQDNDTVIDVLRRVTKEARIQMETRGSGQAVYVEGIANLYEFDKGGKSGWLYRVNGDFPNVSAGAYPLKKGDSVEWLYTLDMGKDVGKEDAAGSNDQAGNPAK
ncbi:DUF4430 domain-containing protein [Paenibacillus athensensis]|uniref:Transcobalamin-like C-terminal domain-containing protein n=1 Tax=Paenibacillus athensensis TaxID=1967502 RepID=A0A4Y8Q5X5_9BACL|nr:DUF4430 domain-containing protein [Paenibacillus athensensis]MCD1259877.1 DUF4430 domain-containing protein [Paenibacillus athensensis]